jgi:hypothetical protein
MSEELNTAFAAQMDLLFSTGNIQTAKLYRGGVLVATFDVVVGTFPARLTGVNPGDLRLRARSADLAAVANPGASGDVLRLGFASYSVVSVAPEFNGLGVTFQARAATGSEAHVGESYWVVPTVTRAERDVLGTGLTAGTMVFQSDDTPGLRVWNGTNWMRFSETVD